VADIFDERRRGLEEEYFRRKDKESLDRLRAALAEEAGEGDVTMQCPRCDGRLHMRTFDEVSIDQCDKCQGIWLDSGELEQIVGKESSTGRWLNVFWPGRAKE
jgi:Zn-finger nucleic acid-binding protein